MILTGDCRDVLTFLPDRSVHCVVTSPPYYGLRDYGVEGQMGLEQSPAEFITETVAVFREVRRVLRDDGVCWLNIGDSSKAKNLLMMPARLAIALQEDGWCLRSNIIWAKPNPMPESVTDRPTNAYENVFLLTKSAKYFYDAQAVRNPASDALIKQVNEGYAGQDTKDFASGGAQSASGTKARIIQQARAKIDKQRGRSRRHAGFNDRWDAMTHEEQTLLGSNLRNVWTIPPKPFKGSHFATFPPRLVEICIKAGTSERGCCPTCGAPWKRDTSVSYENPGNRTTNGPRSLEQRHETAGFAQRLEKRVETLGWSQTCSCSTVDPIPCTVLDPFGGAGTTELVARDLGRSAILIELNPAYVALAEERLRQ